MKEEMTKERKTEFYKPDEEEEEAEDDYQEATRLYPDFTADQPEKAMNFEMELTFLADSLKGIDMDNPMYKANDFRKELRIAQGDDIDLDDVAVHRFRADAAWDQCKI